MAIAAVSISPVGVGVSVSRYVTAALRVVRTQDRVRYRLDPMFTTLEGDRALSILAAGEAQRCYEHGVRAIRELPESQGNAARELELQIGLGVAMNVSRAEGSPDVRPGRFRSSGDGTAYPDDLAEAPPPRPTKPASAFILQVCPVHSRSAYGTSISIPSVATTVSRKTARASFSRASLSLE